MAALLGEELLGAEAAGAGGAIGGAPFQYSGGGIGGAYYGGLLDFNPEAAAEEGGGSSTAFKTDKKPKSINWGDAYNASFVAGNVGTDVNSIITTIGNVYGMYRNSKKIGQKREENTKDRYRAGIVFIGQENRDYLVRNNKMPAYYSTSNIKSLLRRGIMPFGWSSEMAVEQGFGKEIYMHEMKTLTDRQSAKFL